jgi:hypothetical protein
MRGEIKKKVVDKNTNQREEKGIWKGHFLVIPSMWFNVALAAGEKWNVEVKELVRKSKQEFSGKNEAWVEAGPSMS